MANTDVDLIDFALRGKSPKPEPGPDREDEEEPEQPEEEPEPEEDVPNGNGVGVPIHAVGRRHTISQPQQTDLLTAEEVGQILRVNAETVRRMARQGRIPSLRVGSRAYRFPRQALVEWAQKQLALAQ